MSGNRMPEFKNKGLDNAEVRGRRRETNVELRKNKRGDQMAKRRQMVETEIDVNSTQFTPITSERPSNVTLAQLPDIIHHLRSTDIEVVTEATQHCRVLLSKERNSPIQEVIDAGLVPVFVQFLMAYPHSKLQFEAAWTLTNIASGASHQTQCVVNHGAVPYLVKLLSHEDSDVVEQSVWALGNIAGDSSTYRDGVLQSGILPPLISLLSNPCSKITMRRNATWTMSNLCRGKDPQPDFEQVRPCVAVMAQLVQCADEEVMTDAAWALSYLTDGENEKIEAVVNSGVVDRLIQLLHHKSPSVVTPALRAIGNIATGTDAQTQCVLDAPGSLSAFAHLMTSNKEAIRKETCWTISNVTAGTTQQIQAVIDANLIPPLINAMEHGGYRTRKEAAWAISNLAAGGTKEHMMYLVNQGVISPLCKLLEFTDARLIKLVLDATLNILKNGIQNDGSNPFADYYEECSGMERIENLQHHEDNKVYEKAHEIIDNYFADEEEDDESNQGGGGFGQTTFANVNALSFGTAPAALPVAAAGGGFNF